MSLELANVALSFIALGLVYFVWRQHRTSGQEIARLREQLARAAQPDSSPDYDRLRSELSQANQQLEERVRELEQRLTGLARQKFEPVSESEPARKPEPAPPRQVTEEPHGLEDVLNQVEVLQGLLDRQVREQIQYSVRRLTGSVDEVRQGRQTRAGLEQLVPVVLPEIVELVLRSPAGLKPEIGEAVEQLLSAGGLSLIQPRRGDPYDPALHSILRSERSDRDDLRDCVCDKVSPGFKQGGKTIRKAEVSVYR